VTQATGSRTEIRLSRLRDIGWSLWDPIGPLPTPEFWDRKPFADEYDAYLLAAATDLRRGTPAGTVIEDLIRCEVQHMGLGERPDTRARATAVARAILGTEGLWVDPD
jgi:hypothetical protein